MKILENIICHLGIHKWKRVDKFGRQRCEYCGLNREWEDFVYYYWWSGGNAWFGDSFQNGKKYKDGGENGN